MISANFFTTEDTEVLTPNGFRSCRTLQRDTDIYVCHQGRLLLNRCLGVEFGKYSGNMCRFSGRHVDLLVSEKSRLLCLVGSKFVHLDTAWLFQGNCESVRIPFAPENIERDYSITTPTLKKWGRARKIPSDTFLFSAEQLSTLVKYWERAADSRLAASDAKEADNLQHLLLLSGKGSRQEEGFVEVIDESSDVICSCERVRYDGLVWRPVIRGDAVVYRRSGVVFTGSCC